MAYFFFNQQKYHSCKNKTKKIIVQLLRCYAKILTAKLLDLIRYKNVQGHIIYNLFSFEGYQF